MQLLFDLALKVKPVTTSTLLWPGLSVSCGTETESSIQNYRTPGVAPCYRGWHQSLDSTLKSSIAGGAEARSNPTYVIRRQPRAHLVGRLVVWMKRYLWAWGRGHACGLSWAYRPEPPQSEGWRFWLREVALQPTVYSAGGISCDVSVCGDVVDVL